MKTKILAVLAGSMLVSSISFAAPVSTLNQGQAEIGYNYYGLSHDTNNNNYYLQGGVTDNLTLGVEHNHYSTDYGADRNTTDVYAEYKVAPNVSVIAGNRNYDYDNQSNRFIYGLGLTGNLAPKLDGYVSVITNSHTTEWKTGVNYGIGDNVALNVSYKSTKDDGHPTTDGVGVGVNYKF